MRVSATTSGLCVCLFNVGSTDQTQVLKVVMQAFHQQHRVLDP